MTTKSYSPGSVVLTIDEVIVKSWTSLKIDYDEDRWTFEAAASDGEVTRTRTENVLGKITVELPQASSDNEKLTLIEKAAKESKSIPALLKVQIKDLWGKSIHVISEASVSGKPGSGYEKASKSNEWVLGGGLDVNHVAGNN